MTNKVIDFTNIREDLQLRDRTNFRIRLFEPELPTPVILFTEQIGQRLKVSGEGSWPPAMLAVKKHASEDVEEVGVCC